MFDYESYKEIHDLVRCVELYFRQRKQQSEIAEILAIPQSHVSRLLKQAREAGYYTIEFNFPSIIEVASALTEKYDLRHAIVVPTGEPENLKENLGLAAARYFETTVKSGMKIGISCGLTLYYMVQAIRNTDIKKLKIYPLAADNAFQSVDVLPNTLVGILTGKYRPEVTAYALPAQTLATVDSSVLEKRYQEILEYPEVKRIYEEAQAVDIVLSGVGEVSADTPGFGAIANEFGLPPKELKKLGAVAEYNFVPIDQAGNPLIDKSELENQKLFQEISKRVLTVPLSAFKKMAANPKKFVVCVAGGTRKSDGIRAILKGKLANVLVTDFQTAESLLKET